MIEVIRTALQWKQLMRELRHEGQSLGFVPTMGALHAGHARLMQRCTAENDIALASIFVNPTQFNDPKDLEKYPRQIEQDLEILSKCRVRYLFLPEHRELYADSYRFRMTENQLSQKWCGAFRPGHFDGVLTVVLKLLNLTGAQRAYFGEKDYQQLQLIRDMAQALFLDTEIIGVPTLRQADGLALSSRNALLSDDERRLAPEFHRALSGSQSADQARADLERLGFRVEYVEDFGDRRLAAAWLGSVRLIDNVAL